MLIEKAYHRLLCVSLRWRWTVVTLAVLSLVAAGYLARYLGSEFVPLEDQSEFNIQVKAPIGSSLASTDGVMEKIRRRIKDRPWLAYTFVTIGADELQRVNEGTMYVKMVPKEKRTTGTKLLCWARPWRKRHAS